MSSIKNTNVLTSCDIIINSRAKEILCVEFINKITFSNCTVSFFCPNKSYDDEDLFNNPPQAMKMSMPALQIILMNNVSTNGLSKRRTFYPQGMKITMIMINAAMIITLHM